MSSIEQLLGKVLSRVPGESSPGQSGLLESILGVIQDHGLSGLLDQFRQNGLGEVVQSWVGTGSNVPVDPEQVRASLGEENIEQIGQHIGLSPEETARKLAELLPGVVDKLTPRGVVPDSSGLAGILESLKSAFGSATS